MKLKITRTPILNYAAARDVAAFINGRLHIGQKGRPVKRDYLQLPSGVYALCEAMTAAEIENEFISENKQAIESFLYATIDQKFGSKIGEKKATLEKLIGQYDSLIRDSVEKLIMVDIYKAMCNRQHAEGEPKIATCKVDIPVIKKPSVEDLQDKTSVLESICGQPGFVVAGASVYYLKDAPPTEEKLVWRDKTFSCIFLSDVFAFDQNYRNALTARLEQKTVVLGSAYAPILTQLENNISEINKLLNKQNLEHSLAFGGKIGEFGYQKTTENKYFVFLQLGAFIRTSDTGKYYYFPPVKVGVDLTVEGTRIKIDGPPYVNEPNYSHPYVFRNQNGRICYNNLDWCYNFNRWYDIKDRSALALTVRNLLLYGKGGLEVGRTASNSTEAQSTLNSEPIASSYEEAKKIRHKYNVLEDRVFPK